MNENRREDKKKDDELVIVAQVGVFFSNRGKKTVKCEICNGFLEEVRYIAHYGEGFVGECCIHKKELGHLPLMAWIPVNSIKGKEILEKKCDEMGIPGFVRGHRLKPD